MINDTAAQQKGPCTFSRRANVMLSWGIGVCLVGLPMMTYLGGSAGMLKGYLFALAALVVLRQPVAQRLVRMVPSLVFGIRWAAIIGNSLLRAAWFPCLCFLLVFLIPKTPSWLGQISLVLLFPVLLVINHGTRRVIARIAALCLALLLIPLLWVLYFDAEVAPIGVDSMEALFQTDLMEAWQFVMANTDDRFATLAFVLVVCSMLAIIREALAIAPAERATVHLSEPQLWLLLAVGLLIASSGEFSARLTGIALNLHDSMDNFREQQALFSDTREPFSSPGKVLVSGPAPDIVVYIGESTTRRHMGIYGYPRDTTPHLSSLGNQIIRFDDAAAPHTHTAQALREMLTDLNFDGAAGFVQTAKHPANPPRRPYTILDVLNASGMKTWWFSNHNQFGIWDNPVTNIATRAHEMRFFRKSVGKKFDTTYFDDYMVRQAVNVIEAGAGKQSRAIFIHSYAGHADYCKNIPEPWRKRFSASLKKAAYFGDFAGDPGRVDCYDSAISYIDDNLHQVIEAARRQRKPMIVVYVADHGDDADDGSGHNSELHTYQHVAVPLVVFFNDAARAALPTQSANLIANSRLPFETADLYHLLADLARIESSHIDQTRSPGSDTYRPRPRHVLPRGMNWLSLDTEPPRDLRDLRDPIEIAQTKLRRLSKRDREKLCIHHANTLAKVREATLLLSCVEFDAVFDADTSSFRVHHPPDPDLGLDLDTYLAWAGPVRLWMDLKNLDEANLDRLFAALADLDAKYKLKDRLVIEIGADFLERSIPPEHFLRLTKAWRLSLYLPTDQGLRCRDPSLTSSAPCTGLEQKILDTVRQFGFRHISFDSELYPWVRDSSGLSKLSILTWKFSEIIQRSDMSFIEQDLFRKSEIFLIPMKSRYASGRFDCCEHPAYR